jgi:hypothetical protein
MKPKKDWLDYVASLALPAVLGFGGLFYTIHKDDADRKLSTVNYDRQVSREQWKQDAAYVQLLASSNERERQFASEIIKLLRSESTFPPDLVKTVDVLANGLPSDPTTQSAAGTAPTSAKGPPLAQGPVRVFIQYATSAQLCDVNRLAVRLRMAGYATPNPELRVGPLHTDVRYFAQSARASALGVGKELAAIGYPNITKVYQAPSTAELRQVEVWFGSKDNPHIVGTTENGQPLTTENGDYLADANCDPFVLGKSPLG